MLNSRKLFVAKILRVSALSRSSHFFLLRGQILNGVGIFLLCSFDYAGDILAKVYKPTIRAHGMIISVVYLKRLNRREIYTQVV